MDGRKRPWGIMCLDICRWRAVGQMLSIMTRPSRENSGVILRRVAVSRAIRPPSDHPLDKGQLGFDYLDRCVTGMVWNLGHRSMLSKYVACHRLSLGTFA